MATSERSARTRYILVFLIALASLTWMPDIRRDLGHPLGDPGVTIDYHNKVIDVSREAAAAGVRVGDQFDLRDSTPGEREAFYDTESAESTGTRTLRFTSHGRPYVAHIKTLPEVPNVPVIVLRQLGALLLLFLGAYLVLRRPNVATWAFFVFCLSAGAPVNLFLVTGPDWWRPVAELYEDLLSWVPYFFGAIFALHLLHDGPLPSWRAVTEKIVYAMMVLTVAIGAVAHGQLLYFGVNWAEGQLITLLLVFGAYLSIPIILMATYAESRGAARERLRWVIWAFLIGSAALIADTLGSQGNLGFYVQSYLMHSVLTLTYEVVPAAAVVYAILKHRIIDINVAISRTLVYAVLSTIVVGVFALVDMFFTSALSSNRSGLIADMLLALVLGFSFNALHARVDRFMDWLLFRSRHRAEQYIAAVAEAIPYAQTQEHVYRLLIDEPVRAFALAEGELSRVTDEGTLVTLHRARGHGDHQPAADMESLVAILKAQRKAWRLTEQHMAVAIPIFSDNELEAIAFFAPHTNGTDIDGDELALIDRCAVAAGAAFARFKTAELRERVSELEGLLSASRTAI